MATERTVAVGRDTLEALKGLKVHPRETYDDVLRRLIDHERASAERPQERQTA